MSPTDHLVSLSAIRRTGRVFSGRDSVSDGGVGPVKLFYSRVGFCSSQRVPRPLSSAASIVDAPRAAGLVTAGRCANDGPATKLKPRWDVHLSGDDDQLG